MNLSHIKDGWLNLLIKNNDVEQEAIKRVQVCSECPSKANFFGIDVCGECHCPLIAKTRSKDENCPLSKW